MMMIVGGASIALVEHKHGGMEVDTFKTRLEMVCRVIDNGAVSLSDDGYGGAGHKLALDAVEKQIAETRVKIAEDERREAAGESSYED